jgi:cytoskeleton protein RodZ
VSDAINQQSFSLPIIDQSSVEVAEAGIEVTSVVTPELRIEQPTESLATPVIIAQGNLSFSFSGDCWVKVTDSNDKVLFADLKRAEGSLRLTGQPPFAILLGDASSVSLVYNGEPITITKDDGKNSSRFVLGRL